MSSVVELKLWFKNLRKRDKIGNQPHKLSFWSPPRNKVKRGSATTVQFSSIIFWKSDFISLITKLLTIKWDRPSRLSFLRGSLSRFVLTCFLGYLLKKRFHWGTMCWLVVTMITAFLQLENHIQASRWGGQSISDHKGTNNTSQELADPILLSQQK